MKEFYGADYESEENTVDFEVLYLDEVTQIGTFLEDESLEIKNIKDSLTYNIFPEGVLTVEEQESFLSERVFPEERPDARVVLSLLDIDYYDRWSIVRKTHGVSVDDFLWIRFKGENLNREDVWKKDE